MMLGTRVNCKYGQGTVVGFEVLGTRKSWIESNYIASNRILVALDNTKNWILSTPDSPHPFMMTKDLEILK